MNNTTIFNHSSEGVIMTNITNNTILLATAVASNSSLLYSIKKNNSVSIYMSNLSILLLTPFIYVYKLFTF